MIVAIILGAVALALSLVNSLLIVRLFWSTEKAFTDLKFELKDSINKLYEVHVKDGKAVRKSIKVLEEENDILRLNVAKLEEVTKKIMEELANHEH